jgi:hypothetical protein
VRITANICQPPLRSIAPAYRRENTTDGPRPSGSREYKGTPFAVNPAGAVRRGDQR